MISRFGFHHVIVDNPRYGPSLVRAPQPSGLVQEDVAAERLGLLAQEVAEMGAPARASQLIAEIGAFRGIQPSWKTNGKSTLFVEGE